MTRQILFVLEDAKGKHVLQYGKRIEVLAGQKDINIGGTTYELVDIKPPKVKELVEQTAKGIANEKTAKGKAVIKKATKRYYKKNLGKV